MGATKVHRPLRRRVWWDIEMFPEYPNHPHTPYLIKAKNHTQVALFKAESKEGLDSFELQQVKNVVIGYLVNDEFRKKWRNNEQG